MNMMFFCRTKRWTTNSSNLQKSIGSMYGIFTYICLIFMLNVGKYTIHGSYGKENWSVNKTMQSENFGKNESMPQCQGVGFIGNGNLSVAIPVQLGCVMRCEKSWRIWWEYDGNMMMMMESENELVQYPQKRKTEAKKFNIVGGWISALIWL